MRITEICEKGKFQAVYIEGFILPTYDNVGIEIKDGESLLESLEGSKTCRQGISKLRLNIVGESTNNNQDNYREKLGLADRTIGDTKRYCIGYVDIIIVKDKSITISNVEQDAYNLAKSDDELELLTQAIKIKNEITKENEFTLDYSVAIIDKIYINKYFRRMGIASWIHNNIKEVITTYGMVNISAVLLIPGDFTRKANKECNMSDKEYNNMLISHYMTLGYTFISRSVMCKKFIVRPTKYMIGFDN